MSRRLEALRAVLFAYAVGHFITATLFIGWPSYFTEGRGPRPFWPFSVFQFGSWPPTHQGFMNVIAAYDLAVGIALLWAMRDPLRNTGILLFAIVLWVLHGAVHAYHIIWGSSPGQYWLTVGELWLGAILLVVLWPRAGGSPQGASRRRKPRAGSGASAAQAEQTVR